jgi:hypothetical protein
MMQPTTTLVARWSQLCRTSAGGGLPLVATACWLYSQAQLGFGMLTPEVREHCRPAPKPVERGAFLGAVVNFVKNLALVWG